MHKRAASALAALAGLAATLSLVAAPVATGSGSDDSETVTVDAASASGATTGRALQAGTTYTVTAAGTYTWGLAGGTADAECTTLPPDPAAQPNRLSMLYPDDDNFDVYVAGKKVDWQPASGAAADRGCDAGHTYRITFTPASTGTVGFAVVDKTNSNKAGRLTITITAPAAQPTPTPAPQPGPPPAAKPARTTTPAHVANATPNPAVAGATAASPAAGKLPSGRDLTPGSPVAPPRVFGAQFHAIKPPAVAKAPFHITPLGWLTITVSTLLALAAAAFVIATRADAVGSAWRAGLAIVMRSIVGRGGPA